VDVVSPETGHLDQALTNYGKRFNGGKSIGLNVGSVKLREAARKRALEAGVGYGEALRQVRSEGQ